MAVVTAQIRNVERFGCIRATKENKSAPLTKVTILQDTPHLDPSTVKNIYHNQATGIISDTPTSITINIKEELDNVILERNRKHFSKAKNSPWNILLLKNINKDTDYDLEENIQGNLIHLPSNSTVETITVFTLLKELTIVNQTKHNNNREETLQYCVIMDEGI